MKLKILFFALGLLLILVFPVVVSLITILSSYVLEKLHISPIVFIDFPFQITISEYANIIISLLSCFSAALIAYWAFKLSEKVENRNKNQDNSTRKAILEVLNCQIKYDKKIIEEYSKMTGNNLKFLVLFDFSQILEIRELLEKETMNLIFDVSVFLNSLKNCKSDSFQSITDYDRNYQRIENLIEEIEKIIKELE